MIELEDPEDPEDPEDLETLLDLVERKYQRNRVLLEHVQEIEKLIAAKQRW